MTNDKIFQCQPSGYSTSITIHFKIFNVKTTRKFSVNDQKRQRHPPEKFSANHHKKKKINHRKPSTSIIRKGNISRQWSGDTHYLLFSTKAPTAIEPLPVPPTLARTQRLVPCLPCMVENTHGNVEHRNDQKRQSKTIRNGANFNVNHKTLSTSTVTKINANHLKINVKH